MSTSGPGSSCGMLGDTRSSSSTVLLDGTCHRSSGPGGGCSACRAAGAGLGSEGMQGDCDAGSEEGERRGADEL
eukprot:1696705-Heterocapsa_arctica.AAC.1